MDFDHLLNTADDLDSQIKFTGQMCAKNKEQEDYKMATMYLNIYDSLMRYKWELEQKEARKGGQHVS